MSEFISERPPAARGACCAVLAVAGLVAWGASVSARTWTDASGKFRVTAELVEVQGGVVVLRNDDGALLRVPLSKLSAEDRQFLASRDVAPSGGSDRRFQRTKPDARSAPPATDQQEQAEPSELATARWRADPPPAKEPEKRGTPNERWIAHDWVMLFEHGQIVLRFRPDGGVICVFRTSVDYPDGSGASYTAVSTQVRVGLCLHHEGGWAIETIPILHQQLEPEQLQEVRLKYLAARLTIDSDAVRDQRKLNEMQDRFCGWLNSMSSSEVFMPLNTLPNLPLLKFEWTPGDAGLGDALLAPTTERRVMLDQAEAFCESAEGKQLAKKFYVQQAANRKTIMQFAHAKLSRKWSGIAAGGDGTVILAGYDKGQGLVTLRRVEANESLTVKLKDLSSEDQKFVRDVVRSRNFDRWFPEGVLFPEQLAEVVGPLE